MNRIDECFARLRKDGRKAFVVYLGAGDPDLGATVRLVSALDRLGVDIVELGVPFSDPLADGVVNQLSAQRALASGTTPARVLGAVREIRRTSSIPIVLYLYYNLAHRQGIGAFVRAAAEVGVDGLLLLDLPPEEADDYARAMSEHGLRPIYLVAPTTPEERMATIARRAAGFIYYVSREGVTGMRTEVASNVAEMTARIRRHTDLPIAVGFGVSNPDQARAVAACADAVVVGSAVVNQIAEHQGSADLVDRVTAFTKALLQAVKEAREVVDESVGRQGTARILDHDA
jgi:tryptophan synthase alpha chain